MLPAVRLLWKRILLTSMHQHDDNSVLVLGSHARSSRLPLGVVHPSPCPAAVSFWPEILLGPKSSGCNLDIYNCAASQLRFCNPGQSHRFKQLLVPCDTSTNWSSLRTCSGLTGWVQGLALTDILCNFKHQIQMSGALRAPSCCRWLQLQLV